MGDRLVGTIPIRSRADYFTKWIKVTPLASISSAQCRKFVWKDIIARLDDHLGSWADEMWSVLWSYRTTVHSTTNETPFKLTYGEVDVIPVELGEPSLRMLLRSSVTHENLDLIDEVRSMVNLSEQALKQRVAKRYNM
ncbi:hypothetical protein AHAS_Ahas20G0163700 [Arachis hypogaea]